MVLALLQQEVLLLLLLLAVLQAVPRAGAGWAVAGLPALLLPLALTRSLLALVPAGGEDP